MIDVKRIEDMKRLSAVVPPGPWTSGEGYEQMDPGYYFADARGYIAFADEEGTVSPETIEFIAESRQFVPDIIAAYEEQAEEIDKLRKALEEISKMFVCNSDIRDARKTAREALSSGEIK